MTAKKKKAATRKRGTTGASSNDYYQIAFRAPSAWKTKVAQAAKEEGVTPSAWVRSLIAYELGAEDETRSYGG